MLVESTRLFARGDAAGLLGTNNGVVGEMRHTSRFPLGKV